MLGVSPDSYRTWDAGRRATPPHILARARALATHRDDHALLPLPVLALLIGVHVKTLRAAARDGRLPVTYDTRTTFRRLRARATLAAATQFRRSYFGRQVWPADRLQPLSWASVPEDYDVQIRALRRARGVSQAQLATLVGAARKAVVYQWEARKRCPSPVFWARIQAISTGVTSERETYKEAYRPVSHRRPELERQLHGRTAARSGPGNLARAWLCWAVRLTAVRIDLVTTGYLGAGEGVDCRPVPRDGQGSVTGSARWCRWRSPR